MRRFLLFLIITLIFTNSVFSQNYTLNFSGVDDYVAINSNFGLGTSNVTVECWVYIPSISEKGTFVNIGGAGEGYGIGVGGANPSHPNDHSFDHLGNELIFINDMVGWNPTGTNIGTGWHHTAFTIDGSGNTNIYLDGRVVSSFTQTPKVPLNYTYIGASASIARILTNGKIDEVRIWNTERTLTQINANMYKELAGNEANLVAYYKMSDGSGTTLTDNKDGDYNGTITGATWQTSGAFAGPKMAMNFDGTNDFVTLNSGLSFSNATTITIEGWIYPESFNPDSPDSRISNVAGYEDASVLVRIGDAAIDNNQLQFILFTNERLNSNTRLNANTWYHFAAVFDGTKSYLYINGKLDNSMTTTASQFTSANLFVLGGSQGPANRLFDGSMDEVRVWSDARTASEIRTNMTKTLNGTEAGLLAYYRCDYTGGTTLYDNSASGYNGTMTAIDWYTSTAFNTWLGSESGDWNITANWSANIIPSDYIWNVGFYSYTGGNELTSNTNGSHTGVKNMVVSTSATLALPSNLGVVGNLILESNLNIGGYNLGFGNTGYLVEDGGIATGTTGIISFSKNYESSTLTLENPGGLGLLVSTSGAAGSLQFARGFAQASDGVTNGIYRYFNFYIGNSQAVDLVFNYFESEVPGTESNLGLFSAIDDREGGALTWTKQNSAALSIVNNTLSLNSFPALNSQSYRFTAADGDSPLPVELTTFTASTSENKITLNWQTATEINNYGFEIERQKSLVSGQHSDEFEKIGFVEGHGNSNSPKNYSYIDSENSTGELSRSYRLKQIDIDGKFEYSDVVTLGIENFLTIPTEFVLNQNYPNPFNPVTTIKFGLPENSKVLLEVYDILGKKISTLVNKELQAGYHQINFDGAKLSSGMYIYSIKADEFVQVKKLLLMK